MYIFSKNLSGPYNPYFDLFYSIYKYNKFTQLIDVPNFIFCRRSTDNPFDYCLNFFYRNENSSYLDLVSPLPRPSAELLKLWLNE